MRIHLGANSEGYESATVVRSQLEAAGHDVLWHGAPQYDDNDDYPAISIRTVQAVVADEDAGVETRGLLLGGTGAGEVISANKVNGARVVSATSASYVVDARTHADINALVIPTAHVDDATRDDLIAALIGTAFSNGLDDARRLVNVAEFETGGTIEGWMIDS